MNQRLTPDEQAELDQLNAAVTAAIARRRSWLDEKMAEKSDLQVGDPIYHLESGRRLGTVSRLYRYWRDSDGGMRDRSLSIEYEYEESPGIFNNTSCQLGVGFGSKKAAAEIAELRYRTLSTAR